MSFSELAKAKALAIVKIFETSKPFGDYSAVAVLDDGAGISYGVNQFTHRSGSLLAVVGRWMTLHRKVSGNRFTVFDEYISDLADKSPATIARLSRDTKLKQWLREVGHTDELMQQAQREIAFEMYLKPALDACEGSNFVTAMSLAVIYDSINHGSYGMIRDRVRITPPGNGSMKPIEFEKLWITRYVQKRDEWLESVPRLKKTDYRTDFFLAQIARGNWNLDLPLMVHGVRLTEKTFAGISDNAFADLTDDEISTAATAEPQLIPPVIPQDPSSGEQTTVAVIPPAAAPTQNAENIVNVGGDVPPPANFVPEEKSVDAPPPTGFLAKLKFHLAGLGFGAGTLTAIKEFTGIQLGGETVELLKIVIPTLLGLGFIGFLVWYVTEKIVGSKTLKLQSEINTDPNRHNLKINPQ